MEKIIEKFKLIIEEGTVSNKRINFLKKRIEQADYIDQKVKDIVESLEEGDVDNDIIKRMKAIVNPDECVNEIVSAQVKVEKIEKVLDSRVTIYNGFTEKKPMDYVSYDISKKIYISRYKGKKITGKTNDVLCGKLVKLIRDNYGEKYAEIVRYNKACFDYKTRQIILYTTNDKILFDIQHVISMLDPSDRTRRAKYEEFSPKITNFMCVKNDYGGYIVRELIPEEVMYEIILSSNSAISKSFKKDVSMIIKKAREDNKLFVVDDAIVYDAQPLTSLVPQKKFLAIEGCENEMTKKVLETSITTISCIYLFTIGTVKDLREKMKIDNKYSDDDIVIKYGKTEDLLRRSQEHIATFKKYNGNAKLKYYVWVDVEYQSKAETNVKKYFKRMNKLFTCESLEELAILTHDELKEVKEYYGQISDIYCGKLKNIIETHKKEINDYEKKLSHEKHKYELMKKEYELKSQMFAKECESKDQMLAKERETNELLKSLLKKN